MRTTGRAAPDAQPAQPIPPDPACCATRARGAATRTATGTAPRPAQGAPVVAVPTTVGGTRLPALLAPHAVRSGSPVCPVTGDAGPPASPLAVRALTRKGLVARGDVEGFASCPAGHCPVVYYRNPTGTYVGVEDLTVPVRGKATGPDVPVCYCLKVTEGRVFEEVVAKGCCRTAEDVREATRACTGKACHVVNPEGRCCGDHLRASVLRALRAAGYEEQSEAYRAVLAEDPGATCCPAGGSCATRHQDRRATHPGP